MTAADPCVRGDIDSKTHLIQRIQGCTLFMPRQPRLDTPGALHHVMGRGIDGLKIFGDRKDCVDFLDRLKDLCESGWIGGRIFHFNKLGF